MPAPGTELEWTNTPLSGRKQIYKAFVELKKKFSVVFFGGM